MYRGVTLLVINRVKFPLRENHNQKQQKNATLYENPKKQNEKVIEM